MILQFTAPQLKSMVDHAEQAWPKESCGLIIGRGTGQLVRVTRVIAATNILETQPGRFEIDPALRIQVEKEMRDSGTKDRLVGHYHSHPDGSAQPSATDRAMAFEVDLAWVIIGVLDGQAIQTLAHRLDSKTNSFRAVPIRLGAAKKSCVMPQAQA